MTKPERRKAVRNRVRKAARPEGEDVEPAGIMGPRGTINTELALMSREVISADQQHVQWLETWDLEHPYCPFAASPKIPKGGNIFLVKKIMPREQFEMMFGEIDDKRMH